MTRRSNARAMPSIVTSSWVGPTPPEVNTKSNRSWNSRTVRAMMSRSSGITLIARRSTPIRRSSRARNDELVSVTLPERISLPMTTIPAVRSIAKLPCSDRDRALAEIAATDLDVHQRRLAGGERTLESRSNVVRLLDVLSVAAERLDDTIVTREAERGRGGAIWTVELLLTSANLHPAGIVPDDADDVDLLAHHRFELHRVETERAVPIQDDDVALRPCELGRHRVARAYAERAERSGIEPLTGLTRAHGVRGGAYEIAAIADDARVVVDDSVDFLARAERIDRLGVRIHRQLHFFQLAVFSRAQFLDPQLSDRLLVTLGDGELGELLHH